MKGKKKPAVFVCSRRSTDAPSQGRRGVAELFDEFEYYGNDSLPADHQGENSEQSV